jgi:hypothetical protein
MPERPNFYALLELDPTVDDREIIQQRILEKQREWSRDYSMGHPRASRSAKANLALLSEIELVLLNPETRRQEGEKAVVDRRRVDQEKTRELDEAITLLKGSGRYCSEEQLTKMTERFADRFTSADIRKRLREVGLLADHDLAPKRRSWSPGETIDRVSAVAIRENLDYLGLATLYDFLALPPRSSPRPLTDRAEEIYRENVRLGRTDAESSTRNVLAGICKRLFQGEAEKKKYDSYLIVEAMERLKPNLELAGANGLLTRGAFDLLLRQARERGVAAADARAYIEEYAAARNWMILILDDGSELPAESLQLCGFCSALAAATATSCATCGQPLKMDCPRCGTECARANSVCSNCGFSVGDATVVEALLAEGKHLAQAGQIAGAKDRIERALDYWPDWASALQAREQLHQPGTSVVRDVGPNAAQLVLASHPTRSILTTRQRESVFISYAHQDRKWLDRLCWMLTPLTRNRTVELWDDTKIEVGRAWQEELQQALASAGIAVLLVSKHFIKSDFIENNELSPILTAAHDNALRVVWVCVGHCLYEKTGISRLQAAHDPSRPLSSLRSVADQDRVLKSICLRIEKIISQSESEGE